MSCGYCHDGQCTLHPGGECNEPEPLAHVVTGRCSRCGENATFALHEAGDPLSECCAALMEEPAWGDDDSDWLHDDLEPDFSRDADPVDPTHEGWQA